MILGGGAFCPTASLIFKREIVEKIPEWYYTVAPVGDYFLQVFGAYPAGALFIPEPMSVYRKNVSVSWTNSVNQEEKREVFFQRFTTSLELLDTYYNLAYKREIESMILLQHRDIVKYFFMKRKNRKIQLYCEQYKKQYNYQLYRFKMFCLLIRFIPSNRIVHYIDTIIFRPKIVLTKIFSKKR